MRLLVACHCKSPVYHKDGYIISSPPLTFQSSTISPESVEISYIDKQPKCSEYGKPFQYADWTEIPDNYFDYIWFEACPVFGDRFTGKIIIEDALKKLNMEGKIFIGLHNDSKQQTHLKYFERIFNEIGAVEHKLIPKEDLPFYMASYTNYDMSYLIITKKTSGGKRKRKRHITKRNIRKIRNKTSKRIINKL